MAPDRSFRGRAVTLRRGWLQQINGILGYQRKRGALSGLPSLIQALVGIEHPDDLIADMAPAFAM